MFTSRCRIFLGLAIIGLLAATNADSQEKPDAASLVKAREFVFVAQTASPLAGRTRHLTSRYELVVTPDSAIAFLPYFGRAYAPSHNMTGGGIEFTSTDFDYATVRKKKKRWEIILRPHDANDVQELILTVFENGNANLRVSSVSRQAISFNGFIEKRK